LREAGRAKRDDEGKIVRDEGGKALKEPGRLQATRMVGWVIPEYGMAQLSINLTNYKLTPPHVAFDEACKEADVRGLRVTGSELVGLIPKEAMLMAGRHYMRKQGKSPGASEEELIRIAVLSMGLDQLGPFDPLKKIIEYQVAAPGGTQAASIRDFCNSVSADTATPGGGSVSALCAALGASLAAMVANLTVGKAGFESAYERLGDLACAAQALKDQLLADVDRDSASFDAVMTARRLPRKTDEQKEARATVLDEAFLGAARVPTEVMERAVSVMELALQVAREGNPASVSDAGCAALAALAALKGAKLNVAINLPDCPEGVEKRRISARAEELLANGERLADQVERVVVEQLARG
jgi:glutamate formiminotransferase/formiminotetrahydrofolate cyclodeaminase